MTATTTPAHRLEANLAPFEEAAISIAHQLETKGYAEFLLTPGDATAYPFIVLPAGREIGAEGGTATRRNHLVILAASFGGTYEWTGQTMHWDYCAAKWTKDGHEWTGRVVCHLLNALSPLVEQVR